MLEVIGPWGLDQGYVEGFAAVILPFCGDVGPLAAFSLPFDLGRWSFA